MKFYGREKEIGELRQQRDISCKFARFTVVTGRRRIGKTQLIRQAFDDGVSPYVHLVITKKTEKVQCENHQREAERALGITIRGRCERFADLFEDLIKESVSRSFTLVLDEFQEFDQVDDSIYAEMAGVWDRYHSDSKINLVVCGSVNRLMNKIFLMTPSRFMAEIQDDLMLWRSRRQCLRIYSSILVLIIQMRIFSRYGPFRAVFPAMSSC